LLTAPTRRIPAPTLWLETYKEKCYTDRFGQPEFKAYESVIQDKIYTVPDLHAIPLQANRDSINYIDCDFAGLHPCADYRKTPYYCEFIVTQEGKIKNINTILANDDEMKLLIVSLKNMEPVRPATINNAPVNCRWLALANQNGMRLSIKELQDIREIYYMSKREFRKHKRKNKFNRKVF